MNATAMGLYDEHVREWRRNEIATAAEKAFAREQAAVEKQKIWARATADSIERGELPSDDSERKVIASMLRGWVDQAKAPPPPPKRGNPNFIRKVPDDNSVALQVAMQIGFGADAPTAIEHVADMYGVHESVIAKKWTRERREAIAQWLVDSGSNFAHRAGAIRGE